MDSSLVLVIVVAAALVFNFSNGIRDTASVVATSVSTGAMSPRAAVLMAAILNFVGAFISIEVAATIATDVVDPQAIKGPSALNIVFAGLVGAIAWNLLTWYFGLPSSSSHALVGGMIGSAALAVGSGAIEFGGLIGKVLIPAVVAPILALLIGAIAITISYRLAGRQRPGPVGRGFRLGQIVSGGLLALAHGTNDAQKTMGVITLALIADGILTANSDPPFWVIAAAAVAIALGTYSGGGRLIRSTGPRVIKVDPAQGLSAESSAATVIMASSFFGFPLSTTQVISGGVMGVGIAKGVSAVRWGVARSIVAAWLLTLPAAALIGALVYGVTVLAGSGVVGPVLISVIALVSGTFVVVRRFQRGAPVTAT